MSVFHMSWVYLGWALLWAAVQTLVLRQAGFSTSIGARDALLTNLLLAGAAYTISTGLFFWLAGQVFRGEVTYLAFVAATVPVRVAFAWLMLLLVMLLNWLWFYTREQQQAGERKADAEDQRF